MKFMEIFSVDIFSVFGGASCQLQTGFLTKFMFHMALLPGILLILLFAFGVVRTMSKSSKVFTPESVTTALYTLISLVLYTLYVGVSTRIFRLFKCRKIMDVWYLTADYTVVCFEGAWTSTSIMDCINSNRMFMFQKNLQMIRQRTSMGCWYSNAYIWWWFYEYFIPFMPCGRYNSTSRICF